jgi:diamine N-acetyltransferase
MSIKLIQLTVENWQGVINLEVKESQKEYIAPNVMTIAQSKFYPELEVQAIAEEDQFVGLVAYFPSFDFPDVGPEYLDFSFILRFMIDKGHQGRGYGRKAMEILLEEMKQKNPNLKEVHLTVVPENSAAKQFYEKIGFHPTNKILFGEDEYALKV